MNNPFKGIARKMQERKEKGISERAKEVFQICEYEGETWLTHGGQLILPTSFLSDDPIRILNQIRKAYVERNSV